jgi:hypothetical protein
MFEGGAGDDAETLISEWLPTYDRTGQLHGHIAWHGALVALERGDAEQALAIYAEHIQPSVSAGMPINVVSDTASFLWRLQAYGVPHGRLPIRRPPHGLARGGHRRQGGGRARIESLASLVEAGKLAAGPVVPAICRAALAFAEADYTGCARILEPVAHEVVRIGGSGTQREIVEDTLLVALMRSGEAAKARALLARRLHRRPSPRDTRWYGQLTA